jgi:prepilin-type N-terminal cleavage/methylation domain-containing protein
LKGEKGFTLIEMAIVMVLIGLLLGGILKGQELIAAARARNFAAQLDGVKVAYLGFVDRYRALPGDIPTVAANALIHGNPGGCTGGTACNNGLIDADEIYVVWAQLSHAGFIINTYSGSIADTAPSAVNNPGNPFGGYVHLVHDARYDDAADPAQPPVLNIKTGGDVAASVLAELDRKFDDGLPLTGSFRSYGFTAGTVFDGVANCLVGGTPPRWNAAGGTSNCGGALIQ